MSLEEMVSIKILLIVLYSLSWIMYRHIFGKRIIINGMHGTIIASVLMTANDLTLLVFLSAISYVLTVPIVLYFLYFTLLIITPVKKNGEDKSEIK